MVALKSSEIDRFVAEPKPDVGVILIYGPDRGLVSERADKLAARLDTSDGDPFSSVRLYGADVGSDPNRLIDEATTISMFGGLRVIRVRNIGTTNITKAVDPLLDPLITDAVVILEAGDLKRGTGLRKRVEDHAKAIALPCYADAQRDLNRIITEEVAAAGLTMTDAARQALNALLGSDRMVSRAEIQKVCLYARDAGAIDTDDVESIVGDSSALQMDQVIDAAAGGDLAVLEQRYRRLVAAGSPPDIIALTALRHFQLLDQARARVDRGEAADRVVAGLRPPVYFKRRPLVVRQVNGWRPPAIARARDLLDQAMLDARRQPDLAFSIVHDALARISAFSRRGQRGA